VSHIVESWELEGTQIGSARTLDTYHRDRKRIPSRHINRFWTAGIYKIYLQTDVKKIKKNTRFLAVGKGSPAQAPANLAAC